MTVKTETLECALCHHPASKHPIMDDGNVFCCAGCHAVFNILSTKDQLKGYQEHPLFLQALKSGLISNPALIEQMRRAQPDVPEKEMEKLHLEIEEMWCPSCAEVIRLILLKAKGVRNCVVDYATDLASIEFAPRYISKDKIIAMIESLGYRANPFQDNQRKAVSFSLYLRFIVAAFFSLNIMMLAYPLYAIYFDGDLYGYAHLFAWGSLVASFPIMTYSAWPIWRRFINSLRVGILGMETLVVLGTSAAFALSTYELSQGGTHVYFDSMSMVITFILLGKIIESKAKFSAKASLLYLTRSVPRRGRKRFSNGDQKFVLVRDIAIGDTIVVVTGEKIPLDGVVLEGKGNCDESLMTGEALPVAKQEGMSVLAGTFLQNGCLVIEVTTTAEESVLHKIIDMVEHDKKTAYVRAADRIVSWFVPAVVGIAILTAVVGWLYGVPHPFIRAISVLLISCPCAIGIAAPLAESLLMSALASLGVIVRNRGCLSFLGLETAFVFDKTGTITEGHFTVVEGLARISHKISSKGGQDVAADLFTIAREHCQLDKARAIGEKSDETDCVDLSRECEKCGLGCDQAILKGLAQHSTHPIACAVVNAIDERPVAITDSEEIAGRGLRGTYVNDTYLLGSAAFMTEQGIAVNQVASTAVYFAKNGQCLTALVLADGIRRGAKEMIASLAPTQTFLVSGDAQEPVGAVAQYCQFDHWKAECSPLEKRAFVEELCRDGHIVAMLGDGINDAPALSRAHVGISVVNATDVSIQVSDVLLTTDRLEVIPKMRALARKGQRIIRQNLFWAFFYNVIGIGLAASGMLSPLFAAFAMVSSSIIVLLNAQTRLRSS